jgi:hypothetical protein
MTSYSVLHEGCSRLYAVLTYLLLALGITLVLHLAYHLLHSLLHMPVT